MHLAAEEIDHQVLIAHDAGEILAIEGDHVIRAERRQARRLVRA